MEASKSKNASKSQSRIFSRLQYFPYIIYVRKVINKYIFCFWERWEAFHRLCFIRRSYVRKILLMSSFFFIITYCYSTFPSLKCLKNLIISNISSRELWFQRRLIVESKIFRALKICEYLLVWLTNFITSCLL